MSEVKIVINDPKTGKSYQKSVEFKKIESLKGLKIGDVFDAGLIDLPGYQLRITGGSDKDGFPMKKGVHTSSRVKILMSGGVGYNAKEKGIRRRKSVRGELISEQIAQINAVIVKEGKKKIEEFFSENEKE